MIRRFALAFQRDRPRVTRSIVCMAINNVLLQQQGN